MCDAHAVGVVCVCWSNVLEADEALSACATRVPPYDVLLLGLFLVHYDKKPLLAGELLLLVGLM